MQAKKNLLMGRFERKSEWRAAVHPKYSNSFARDTGTFNECLDMGQVNLDILQPHLKEKETQLTMTDIEIIVK